MSRSQPIDDPTESEKQALRSEHSEIIVSCGSANHKTRLHIPKDGSGNEPQCKIKREHKRGSGRVNYQRKSISCYPPGWAKWCNYCVESWRGEHD